MTDFDRTIEFLHSLGIEGYTSQVFIRGEPTRKFIRLCVGEEKITGYNGFLTEFCFNEVGEFIELSIGED